jgi:hypothetical protein
VTEWIILIVASAIVGMVAALALNGTVGVLAAALIPWLGMLAWLLYNEYFVPYRGGGASMWPIAQLFAGTVAALIGIASYFFARRLFKGIV